MKKYLLKNIFVLAIFILLACEKNIPLEEISKEQKLVVNSIFSEDSFITVNITKSLGILSSSDFENVENAEIAIFENNVFIENLFYTGEGNYLSNLINPSENNEYKVEVITPEFGLVEAIDTIPIPVNVEIITAEGKIATNGFQHFDLKISFQDPEEIRNYYNVQVYTQYDFRNRRVEDSPGFRFFEYYGDLLEDSYNGRIYGFFSDRLINGKTTEINLLVNRYYVTGTETTGTIKVYLHSISETYYKFLKSFDSQKVENFNPFSEPVKVYSNIEGGLGIFTGYSSSVDSVTVEW